MNIWRENYCLENDYDSKTKLSIIFSISYINKIGKVRLRILFLNVDGILPYLVYF